MNSEKGLELALELAKNREKYDVNAKRLFSRKEILAPLLKSVVAEYQKCTTEEIMDLIEGDTLKIGTQAVSPDMANVLVGERNEEKVAGEASSYFDVVFRSLLPGKEDAIGINLHIDVEVQADGSPGYPIINRGTYYACRKLTMQLLKVSDTEKGYRALEKVYSIWICLDKIPKIEQNSIAYYKMINYKNVNIERKDDGDLLEIVLIRLGNPYELTNTIVDMLNGIFTSNGDRVMSYIPKSDQKSVKEVEDMLYIYDVVEAWAVQKGMNDGMEKGIEKGIKEFIELCQEINDSEEKVTARLVEKFELSEEKANEYIKKYWKNNK